MKILLVYPQFPRTYWGFEYTLSMVRKKSLLPPLGLITVAALLPDSWELRLCDMNVRELRPSELDWADVVFISAMLIQQDSMAEVATEARRRGKPVVCGGPFASTSPDNVQPYADCVVVGEAEDLIAELADALESDIHNLPARLESAERPNLSRTRVPRYDLLQVNQYQTIGVQWSRGCPYNCEFCDIIEIYGRRPRSKSAVQFCDELDAVYATGFRGSVFVVDDNFIGDRPRLKGLLRAMAAWMRAHGDPFHLYTEATVNLSKDEELIDLMVEAGFTRIFFGIETPDPVALKEAQKEFNARVDLEPAIRKVISRGLEVMGGFIVGFDADDAASVKRLEEWIVRSPIPMAMVGLLNALPGTQLERRLIREGRMRSHSGGDQFVRPNFETKLNEVELLGAYARLLEAAYTPRAYFTRALRALELCTRSRTRFRFPKPYGAWIILLSVWRQGILAKYRFSYWRYVLRALTKSIRRFPEALGMALTAEHMIRYTAEDVLPSLRRAIEEARGNGKPVLEDGAPRTASVAPQPVSNF